MGLSRVRFTTRRLMIAVAAMACVLGIVPQVLSHLRHQSRIKAIASELGRPTTMSLATEVPLGDALGVLASGVSNPDLPGGLPIRFDPSLSARMGALIASPVSIDVEGAPLSFVLDQVLSPLGLTYVGKDGFVTITALGKQPL
jgi:hypothetical protein